MAQGWVCVHRKLLDNPIFKNDKLFRVFMFCLLRAQHTAGDQLVGDSVVYLDKGQLATGRIAISEQTGLSQQNVRTAISKLEKLGILTIKPTTKYSVITMVNWNQYQQTNQQVTNKQPTSNQQVTTSNNVNNDNNVEKEHGRKQVLPPCPHQEILEIWSEVMPDQTQPRVWDGQRAANLGKRWKECFSIMKADNSGPLYTDKQSGLEFWRSFFGYMRESSFLLNDCKPFGLDWLVVKGNFNKIFEGKYHG